MTTVHSMERAKERLGLRGTRAAAFIEMGLTYGKTADHFKTAPERKYLAKKCDDNTIAKVHEGYCFIVNTDWNTCVTVYKLPVWFGKTHRYAGKERIRNQVKYNRKYNCYDLEQ